MTKTTLCFMSGLPEGSGGVSHSNIKKYTGYEMVSIHYLSPPRIPHVFVGIRYQRQ